LGGFIVNGRDLTLTEFIIIVVILGIFVAVVTPQLSKRVNQQSTEVVQKQDNVKTNDEQGQDVVSYTKQVKY